MKRKNKETLRLLKHNMRLTRGMLQKLNQQNAVDSRDSSSRDSVIVINDSDSETNDGNKGDDETNVNNKEDTSLSIIECNSTPYTPVSKKLRSNVSKTPNHNNNRPSIIPLDNDLSIINLSDVQESELCRENIAPSRTEDDVVELWSCVQKSPSKSKTSGKRKRSETNVSYVIDKRPNLEYLELLKIDKREVKKKEKKKKKKFYNKTTLDESIFDESILESNQRISKHLASSYKKKQYDDELNSTLTESNGHCSKKINSGEKSSTRSKHRLREIVVDGCNVAMGHTNGNSFSEKGIEIVVNYFMSRGHTVKVFLPQHVRKREFKFLEQLYREGIVVFTPSRYIAGRQITPYDDRYILEYATTCDGIVISSDQYRDLYKEKPEWRNTILNRLLTPTFVGDYIMFPEDPLGKSGPNLDRFLRH